LNSGQTNYVANYDNLIYCLHYLFYADGDDADSYTLSAEKLIGDRVKGVSGWFETYTKRFGGELVNDRYSKALFEKVDEKVTDVTITNTDEYTITDKTVSNTVWDILFGTAVKHETSYTLSAIQKVTVDDMAFYSGKTAFCDNFYIAESDYADFTEYVREASARNETTYLFRYYQSEYRATTEYKKTSKWFIAGGNSGVYEYADTNAYFAQMWVQLDFDIIDLTFTKDNALAKIPVVMSPMDISADADYPVSTQPEKGISLWQILLTVLFAGLILFLLFKFFPYVFWLLIKIVSVPFKVIGALFKNIRDKTKPMRERNRQIRLERKERRRLEREQERERRAAEKERKRKEKRKRKERERKSKRVWKLRDKERKRIKRHRKEAEEIFYKQYKKAQRKKLGKKNDEKSASENFGRMTDDELAEIFYSEYYDRFGEAFPDDDPSDF